jgi:hypothetical protein
MRIAKQSRILTHIVDAHYARLLESNALKGSSMSRD